MKKMTLLMVVLGVSLYASVAGAEQPSATPAVVPAAPAAATTPDSRAQKHGLYPNEILSADELKAMIDAKQPILIFDARDKRSYDDLRIAGAILPMPVDYFVQLNLMKEGIIKTPPNPEKWLAEGVQKYPKDSQIVTYCNANCGASAHLLFTLKKLGFTNLRSMEDGIQEWEKKGYPVEGTKAVKK